MKRQAIASEKKLLDALNSKSGTILPEPDEECISVSSSAPSSAEMMELEQSDEDNWPLELLHGDAGYNVDEELADEESQVVVNDTDNEEDAKYFEQIEIENEDVKDEAETKEDEDEQKADEAKQDGNDKVNDDDPKKKFTCKRCGNKYVSRRLLHRHFQKRHRYPCPHCERVFRREDTCRAHIRTHEKPDNPFKCDICGVEFVVAISYIAHMERHTGNIRFSCDLCDYKCTRQRDLVTHQIVHTNEKKYLCDLCGTSFGTRSSLVSHKRYGHSTKRQVQCKMCPSVFKHPTSLRKHVRSEHLGEKYNCNVCDKVFKRPDHLKVGILGSS